MEYTVKQLSDLAGVSSRTLRYYDEINLLKPKRTNSSGYRLYGSSQVDMLQQILFYRELGLELKQIKEIIYAPEFDLQQALREHRDQLLEKREQLNVLIENVDKSLARIEGRSEMTDQEKFAGFKRKFVDENEQKYGKEIRGKYGDATVDASNAKLMGMSEEEYAHTQELEAEVIETLLAAMETGDPSGELGQKTAELHRQWLSLHWDKYTPQAHAGLAEMYIADERFTSYYDQHKSGAAKFLRDTIVAYTNKVD